VPELAREVVRRQFPTKSGNVSRLVATRVKDLVKRGLLSQAPDHRGFEPQKKSGQLSEEG